MDASGDHGPMVGMSTSTEMANGMTTTTTTTTYADGTVMTSTTTSYS